jgi:hypothetical protein
MIIGPTERRCQSGLSFKGFGGFTERRDELSEAGTMLHTRWNAEAWPQMKAEFTKALALRSQIRRAGRFN